MENSINKVRAAQLIVAALAKVPGMDTERLEKACDASPNLVEDVIAAFERLSYRERTTIGMRLMFDAHHSYRPTRKFTNEEAATAFEMTSPNSITGLNRRSYKKIAARLMERIS